MNKGLMTGVPEAPVSEWCTETDWPDTAEPLNTELRLLAFSSANLPPIRFILRVKYGAIHG